MSPFLRSGLVAIAIALAADQASKLWLLNVYDLARRGGVALAPFLDLVLVWNKGISYGWFQNGGDSAQAILVAIKVAAVVAMAVWLARAQSALAAVGLGLIIGGAIGNGIDRLAYGAVMDFALLHAEIGGRIYNWYVFNLADCAIVAGVAGLLYDSLLGRSAAKAP